MTCRSDLAWEILERIDLTDPHRLDIARSFVEYVSEHLSQDGQDPEVELPKDHLALASQEVVHWLTRMLSHKRGEINHWSNDLLERFCDDFEVVLESIATPSNVMS